jgi:hypothetical protein
MVHFMYDLIVDLFKSSYTISVGYVFTLASLPTVQSHKFPPLIRFLKFFSALSSYPVYLDLILLIQDEVAS